MIRENSGAQDVVAGPGGITVPQSVSSTAKEKARFWRRI
jgi:hypothetical protein